MSNNIFTDASIQKDENLDINALLKDAQKSETSSVKKEEAEQPVKEETETKVETKGLVLKNDELIDTGSGPKRDIMESDERQADFNKAIEEQDELYEARKAVTIIKNTESAADYVQLIEELGAVKKDENGKSIIDLRDDNGNKIEPRFIKLKEETGNKEFDIAGVNTDSDQDSVSGKSDDSIAKKEIISVIIDKTGLGSEFAFTDEEREKLIKSDLIEVKELKVLDVKTQHAKRSKKSFSEALKEYDYNGPKTQMTFPNSGYKADIKGLGSGEYADIAMNVPYRDDEAESIEGYKKKLSVVYNKMCNVSVGDFKNINEFAEKTAWIDIHLAIYGLYLSTEKDEQIERFACTNCNNEFNLAFNTHSLLRLEKSSLDVLNNIKKIVTSPASKYRQIQNESPVNKSKLIELPDSKMIVELGIASAKDYMENYLPLMDPDIIETLSTKFTETYIESVRDLMIGIRSVRMPLKDGSEYICEDFEEILAALYKISTKDFKLIEAYIINIIEKTNIVFEIKGVCPHCGYNNVITVLPEHLVFLKYHHTRNTMIDLKNITEV